MFYHKLQDSAFVRHWCRVGWKLRRDRQSIECPPFSTVLFNKVHMYHASNFLTGATSLASRWMPPVCLIRQPSFGGGAIQFPSIEAASSVAMAIWSSLAAGYPVIFAVCNVGYLLRIDHP